MAPPASHRAAALAQHEIQLNAAREEEWRQGKHHRRQRRDEDYEGGNARIHREVPAAIEIIGWNLRSTQRERPRRQQGARNGARHCEQRPLDNELAHESTATPAQRAADRELALAPQGASEKQIRDVHARKQQVLRLRLVSRRDL